MSKAEAQIPQYKCHKIVGALKIIEVEHGGVSTTLHVEKPFAPINVGLEWKAKNDPKAGGYIVYYEGGYTSYSPKEAFESGYTLIS
jgi:hypothetical protein